MIIFWKIGFSKKKFILPLTKILDLPILILFLNYLKFFIKILSIIYDNNQLHLEIFLSYLVMKVRLVLPLDFLRRRLSFKLIDCISLPILVPFDFLRRCFIDNRYFLKLIEIIIFKYLCIIIILWSNRLCH
jgi:hypothetical protein